MATEKKLSALIREGAKLRPQAFNNFVQSCVDGMHTCALSAAYEAATGKLPPRTDAEAVISHKLRVHLGYSLHTYLDVPPEIQVLTKWPYDTRELIGTVIGLNDEAQWSREEIADWLESIGY